MGDIGESRREIGLTDGEVERFHDQGYVVVRSLLDADDIEPLLGEFADTIDRTARWSRWSTEEPE